MKKPTRKSKIRTKRKNQNSRIRHKKANKHIVMSLLKKKGLGLVDIKDKVMPIKTKGIW